MDQSKTGVIRIISTNYLHTSRLEGINNRIKVIKRMAYGYRDNDCFFMKIKIAFPGKARRIYLFADFMRCAAASSAS
ncbi:transposase [Scandinavium hiltneri]|uniref:transposase n=1 Tax=Scandinavium hiltneri TaxID=2926519 RepID=UPI002869B382|nr:transposase [Scandinavium hiltneri]